MRQNVDAVATNSTEVVLGVGFYTYNSISQSYIISKINSKINKNSKKINKQPY